MACRGILTGSGNTVDSDVESLDVLGATDQEFTSDDDGKVIIKSRALEITDSGITANVPFETATEIPTKNGRAFKDGSFTPSNTERTVFIDATPGNITVTLPHDELTRIYVRTDASGNTITLSPASGLINGAATDAAALNAQYAMVIVVSDGTDFYVK